MSNRKIAAAFTLSLAATAATQAFAQDADRYFSGPYIGAEAGLQQIIAGSSVNGVDILAEDRRFVADLFGGFRHQFPFGLILGAEGAYGLFDGNLQQFYPVGPTGVSYDGGDQFSYGGTLGWVVGPERTLMLYGYLKETKRTFDIVGVTAGTPFFQQDKQGMLRYGGGAELRVAGRLHVRAAIGAGRADFGGRITNFDPKSKVEASIGLLAQF